jgi:hypothetical protein
MSEPMDTADPAIGLRGILSPEQGIGKALSFR